MIECLRSRSNDTFLEERIGFVILQHRAGCNILDRTITKREIKVAKKEWCKAIISANSTERNKVGRKKPFEQHQQQQQQKMKNRMKKVRMMMTIFNNKQRIH
jgi:hypothetical protein